MRATARSFNNVMPTKAGIYIHNSHGIPVASAEDSRLRGNDVSKKGML